jgi:hypothetical protein
MAGNLIATLSGYYRTHGREQPDGHGGDRMSTTASEILRWIIYL